MIRGGLAHSGEASPVLPATSVRPGAIEQIAVTLIPAVAVELQRLHERTKLSNTDLVNRAITSYEFFDAQMRDGRDVLIRNNQTGDTHLVRFL